MSFYPNCLLTGCILSKCRQNHADDYFSRTLRVSFPQVKMISIKHCQLHDLHILNHSVCGCVQLQCFYWLMLKGLKIKTIVILKTHASPVILIGTDNFQLRQFFQFQNTYSLSLIPVKDIIIKYV